MDPLPAERWVLAGLKNENERNFPGDPVVKTQGAQVQSLVRKLGSCMLYIGEKEKKKMRGICKVLQTSVSLSFLTGKK